MVKTFDGWIDQYQIDPRSPEAALAAKAWNAAIAAAATEIEHFNGETSYANERRATAIRCLSHSD